MIAKQSMYSSSSDDNISSNSDSEYSYHGSDDDLPLSMRWTFYSGKDGTKRYRKSNVWVRVANRNKVSNKSRVKLLGRSAKTKLKSRLLYFSNKILKSSS